MSEVDDESLYSFGSGQPDDTRAADSTSYSTEWAPLPASGGASPRARSPRSDGASTTAALSFSTAAVSADAALDDVDEVESVAAPGDDEPPPVEEEEEEDILDRLRRGAAAIQARRGADDAADDAVDAPVDEEPAEEAGEEDILDRLRREQAPLQARSPADDAGDALLTVAHLGNWSGAADEAAPPASQSPRADDAASLSDDGTGASASYSADFLPEPDRADDAPPSDDGREETPAQSPRASDYSDDFAPAAGGFQTPALLTVADLGDWSGAAEDAAPAPQPPSSPSEASEASEAAAAQARRWSIGEDAASSSSSRDKTPPATPPRDDSSYEDDFAPDTASPRISQEGDEEPRSPGTTGLAVGTLVEAIYGDTDEWFPGTIEAANADGTYAVAYDDGDREPRVDAAFVRVVLHGGASSSSSSGSSYATTSDDEASGAYATTTSGDEDEEVSASAASSASSPRRADSEYSEDFAADDDAARPIDEVVLGAQRVGPRAPAATRDDAAAAAASAAATQRALARVEASYENDDFELPDAPDFVRQLAIGVGQRIGTGRMPPAPPPERRVALDARTTRSLAARVRERQVPEPVCRYARRVAAQLRGERRPRRAAPRAARSRFHATPAALDRVKIKASLALLRTTHDRVNSEALAAFEASLPGGPIREDDPATKQRRLAGRLRADAAQRYVESDEFYARSALLGDGFAMLGESMAEATAEHRRRTEERDASRALSITRNSSSPLDEAVATMDETRENVASYMADVAADPKRAAFRDEVLRMLHRGEELRDFGLAPYRLGATVPGVFVS
ncbi:unnamed protein product [Pelagomonas calceolata]|uniref:Tudor domain-containing protein n=1 Tax=Pelagomonas calceolata TaxID=35677 RepID=A0A8J2S740_9STRA|nr:unnamed protein product [Pelagomonas calceolata]